MLIPIEEIRRMLNQNEACKDALLEAIDALANQQSLLHAAEQSLAVAKGAILLKFMDDPTALGKNEAIRDANLRAMCQPGRAACEELEQSIIKAKSDVECLRLEIDYLKTKLRIYELAKEGTQE